MSEIARTPIAALNQRLLELDGEYRALDRKAVESGDKQIAEQLFEKMLDIYQTSYGLRNAIAALVPRSLHDTAIMLKVVRADLEIAINGELDRADYEGCRRALNAFGNILEWIGENDVPAWAG